MIDSFKIYGLKYNDAVRYIGQTKFTLNKRLNEHIRDNKVNKRTSWIKWLNSQGRRILNNKYESNKRKSVSKVSAS